MTEKHPHIEMCECKSSQIKSYGYDTESKTLAVQFNNGGTYHYTDVTPDIFEEMGKAESVGSFLHKRIKGKFGYTKLGE